VREWCAEKGIAPKLIGCEVLAGGCYMVVMELLDASWVKFTLDKGKGLKENFIESIKELHEAGMVHGDIQRENVMMKEGGLEIWLVDFDWAGIIEQV
jgi:tRNA A-37 threonylcarbamoyl transferase component Bud32